MHMDDPQAITDPARLRLLAETGLLDTSAIARIPTLDRVARLAAYATGAALAQVNLITADAQVPAAAYVDDTRPGPRGARLVRSDAAVGGAWRTAVGLDASYCQHVVRRGTSVVIDDAQHDPLVHENRATREAGIGAYAAVPLVTPDGTVLGSVCVVEFQRRHWDESDIATLTECADLAGEEIAARLGASHALRESEQRLRLALQAARLGSWSLDVQTDALIASAGCKALFGRTDDVAFSYADLLESIHADDRAAVKSGMEQAVRDGVEYRAEYRVILPDGAQRWLMTYGQAVYDLTGVPLRMVGLMQDVTERHEHADERERLLAAERTARAEAELANRAKGEFLALMSHELRTPLNAIGGFAELIELGVHGPVTPEQKDDLRRIRMSQRHLLGLINEMLNYTRLEHGTVQYAAEPVSMRETLVDAAELMALQVAAKGLEIEVQACDASIVALADVEKVGQVLANLLSNAVKFTPGGGRLVIDCEASAATVQVHVRDTGIGIPAGKLAAIFDPFVQVRSGIVRPNDGAGLGLSISREIARGMGGDLRVVSVEGEGSRFTLTLPRYTGDADGAVSAS